MRRWHHDLKARDVFGAPAAAEADQQLKHRTGGWRAIPSGVFTALHQM